jgi:coenzyme F420-reducing hydrogenase beta subunit
MKVYNKKAECCGCTACASVCPNEAISMQPDDLGFLYPVVDVEKCNNCGLCKELCSFNADYSKKDNFDLPFVYAVRHKNMKELETSRSGAMFIALSDWILNNGGVVYGAGYMDHFRVAHKRATTKEERNEFKGSKYVQSDMNTVFEQVRNDLKRGIQVLFSGTPCQTSGLRASLLNNSTANLYICDIVCHGVPSPYFWRDYLNYIEKRQKSKVIKVDFRDKGKFGWTAHKESFTFSDTSTSTSTFTFVFYQHIMFRHSCGVCHFTNLKRPSDITLADYWGWQKVDKEFNADNKGISLVLVNTPKGKLWFDAVKKDINYIESDTTKCLQPNLQCPTAIHPKRNKFEKDYINKGFVYVAKKYGNMGALNITKRKFKTLIKWLIKK